MSPAEWQAEAAEWQARMRAACQESTRRRAADRAGRAARAERRARGLQARQSWKLTRLDARAATRPRTADPPGDRGPIGRD